MFSDGTFAEAPFSALASAAGSVALTGVFATGYVGSITIPTWIIIIPDQTPGYGTITPVQDPTWVEIIPTQAPSWDDIN